MKQAAYVLIEFLEDPDFIAWVKHPDQDKEAYWQHFMESYPDKKPVIETARQFVQELVAQTGQSQPTAVQSESMRRTILQRIQGETAPSPFIQPSRNPWSWVRAAASVAIVAGLGVTAYWYSQKTTQPVGYRQFTQTVPVGITLRETRNDNTTPLTISLSDGSSVVLQPGSQLSYPNKFKQRQVYLVGKAFFEVVKDPTRPFLVYTRGIATKVLGTSFSINAPEVNEPINVAVKTGRVAIYPLERPESANPKASTSELGGLVLTPNQSAEYLTASHQLVRKADTVSTFAQQGTLAVARQSFDFDETPLSVVFSTLERAYGVDIVYNKTALGNCSLSASLVGQPFHEKLAVICKAFEAQYSLQDNRVIITGGQPCN